MTTTATAPISRFPVPELHDLPDDIRQRILAVQEKSGFVPNVFLVLAYRPEEFRAFFAYHDALMLREDSSLSKAEREMIITVISAQNQCLYCVMAHGALLRIFKRDPLIADQVAINYCSAALSPRERAMLDFATRVNEASHTISDTDFEHLRAHGFDDEDIWDIASITGLFGLSNRIVAFTGMEPNPEFYLMGRQPRKKPAEA